MGLFKKSG